MVRLLATLLAVGCTPASLELLPGHPPLAVDDALTVEGEVCTLAPEDLVFPMRVLFLVDASESMEITDPPDAITGETGRQRAVRETVEQLLGQGGDVRVSLVRFSSEAQSLTSSFAADGTFESYFTSDLAFVDDVLPFLAETDRTTNYINALSEAYSEVRDELAAADQESLALSTYHVILISDGIPDAEGGETIQNSAENILDAVEGLQELGKVFHVGRLHVSTALLGSGSVAVDAPAEQLLGDMAERGEGTYRAFESGSELNFLFVDLTVLRRVFTLSTLVVDNATALTRGDVVHADSDGDGASDPDEAAAGSNPSVPDTDGDGCRDGLEATFASSGMDALDPDDCECFVADYCFDEDDDRRCDNGCLDRDRDGLCDCIDLDRDGVCDPENYPDTDGDGLADCEERYSGSNRSGPDTDGDGLPDFLEFRAGTAPDLYDVDGDLDWDAVPNGEEVRSGTDPLLATALGRSALAHRYTVVETETRDDGRSCYAFEVGNVTLIEAAAGDAPTPTGLAAEGANRILVYLGEVPFDDQQSYARFRVACVEARFLAEGNYRDPPSGVVHLEDDDFVALDAFDAQVHCIDPGRSP